MLEVMLCSMLTIVPDFLYRRYVQGKRIGREITLYSVWFELRYGITACLILTISLITMIFYFHPSATTVASVYRTVPILPEGSGRVDEIYVGLREEVKAGQPLFKLDTAQQQAAAETARRRIVETDAALLMAKNQLAGADAQVQEAQSAYQQAEDEFNTKSELLTRNASTVSRREVERLQVVVSGRQAGIDAAIAARQSVETQISALLPAQRASAEAALAEAQTQIDRAVVRAGVDGVLEQFTLRKGDVVNPLMRPAGILVPTEAGRQALIASFNQIEAQVMKVGMLAEVSCASRPFTIIPMVVTQVQGVVATGQLRPTDVLVDLTAQQATGAGTLTVFLEPLYAGGIEGIPPGSNCIGNAYTSNEERLATEDVSTLMWFYLHAVDAVGLVHGMILRLQAVLLPVQTLVLSGH